jgi:hypothetical protein
MGRAGFNIFGRQSSIDKTPRRRVIQITPNLTGMLRTTSGTNEPKLASRAPAGLLLGSLKFAGVSQVGETIDTCSQGLSAQVPRGFVHAHLAGRDLASSPDGNIGSTACAGDPFLSPEIPFGETRVALELHLQGHCLPNIPIKGNQPLCRKALRFEVNGAGRALQA